MRFKLEYACGTIAAGNVKTRALGFVLSDDGKCTHAMGTLYDSGWEIVIYGPNNTDALDKIVTLFEDNTGFARTGEES